MIRPPCIQPPHLHASWIGVVEILHRISQVESVKLRVSHLSGTIKEIYSIIWQEDSGSKIDSIARMFESLPADVTQQFLAFTFPRMCSAIVSEIHLVGIPGSGIPFLPQQVATSISFSPKQAFLLLASSFLCIPLYSEDGESPRTHRTFHLFFSNKPQVCAKLQCMLNYFNLVVAAQCDLTSADLKSALLSDDRKITLTRLVDREVRDEDFWLSDESKLVDVDYRPRFESIEVHRDAIQADFANKSLGGGVLRRGCVQEEIRFMISPECLLSVLLCDKMKDNEAVLIKNTVIFSDYSGYSGSFRCTGFSPDILACMSNDQSGLPRDDILAFDAIPFGIETEKQFGRDPVLRELNKCFVALSYPGIKPFATGNWGCGAFGGDTQLKAVIQWLAASAQNKKLIFCPFDDTKTSRFPTLVKLARDHPNVTVGKLCESLFQAIAFGRIGRSNAIDFFIDALEKNSICPESAE